MMSDISGIIVGAIFAAIAGIAASLTQIGCGERRAKIRLSKAILGEIQVNWVRLERLSKENKRQYQEIWDIRDKEGRYARRVYLQSLDKIGLLDEECVADVLDYYYKLQKLDELLEEIRVLDEFRRGWTDDPVSSEYYVREHLVADVRDKNVLYYRTADAAYEIGKKLKKNLKNALDC